jgi:hypothetical protein
MSIRALLRCLDYFGIVDLTHPSKLIFELAGAGLRRRFGRDIRRVNWVDLVPPRLGDAGQRARERIRKLPCGFYHKLTVEIDGAAVTAETVLLPVRHRQGAVPHAAFGFSWEVGKGGATAPAGWLTPSAHVAHYVVELVDIGRGSSWHD